MTATTTAPTRTPANSTTMQAVAIERFGPVRHVEPVHVLELGFEAIAPSSRHRSGVAVRFPRMLRWRRDKAAADADTLEALVALIPRA